MKLNYIKLRKSKPALFECALLDEQLKQVELVKTDLSTGLKNRNHGEQWCGLPFQCKLVTGGDIKKQNNVPLNSPFKKRNAGCAGTFTGETYNENTVLENQRQMQ